MSIPYAQVPLDRASEARRNPDWIARQLDRAETQILCVHQSRNLLRSDAANPGAAIIRRPQADALLLVGRKPVFLGLQQQVACFALDLSRCDEHQLAIPPGSAFRDLRQQVAHLSDAQASLLAYARGLVHWHDHNQFCGRCGALTYSRHGGHARRCSKAACRHTSFPRTDPAVIMLIEDRSDPALPRCLLARNRRYTAPIFSTLAGFVDPGESLEQAVAREALEEVGIRVDNIRYQASQPWPFPATIMLGFRATVREGRGAGNIRPDNDEIVEARWFAAGEIRAFGEWGGGGQRRYLPRADSIARLLICSWLADVSARVR